MIETDEQIAADMFRRWGLNIKCLGDWEYVVHDIARAVEQRANHEFVFSFSTGHGSSCIATIQASNYDEALARMGSASKPTFFEEHLQPQTPSA